jgi:uncharacterized protein (TIGR02145 family)
MKTLILFSFICFACTKIEYIIEQPMKTTMVNDSINVKVTKPAIDTVKPVKPAKYVLHDIDGNVYDSIVIGLQTWMTENLKTTKFNDGTPLIDASIDSVWQNTRQAAYGTDGYNVFYNFPAVYTDGWTDNKLCPVGWHVSTDSDWMLLEASLGVPDSELNTFGSQGTIVAYWLEQSGFKARLEGMRTSTGEYIGGGHSAFWWCGMVAMDQLIHYNGSPVDRDISLFLGSIDRRAVEDNEGLSVRCVKN